MEKNEYMVNIEILVGIVLPEFTLCANFSITTRSCPNKYMFQKNADLQIPAL